MSSRPCHGTASGSPSCATTTRWTWAGSHRRNARTCSTPSAPSRTCSSTTAGSGAGWRPYSTATAAVSRWPPACSSPCPEPRPSGTGRDRHGREPRSARTRGDPHPHAVGRHPQRRLLACGPRTAAGTGHQRGAAGLPARQRDRPAPRPARPARMVRAHPEHPARMRGDRLRPPRGHRRRTVERAGPSRDRRPRRDAVPAQPRRPACQVDVGKQPDQPGRPLNVAPTATTAPSSTSRRCGSTTTVIAGSGCATSPDLR